MLQINLRRFTSLLWYSIFFSFAPILFMGWIVAPASHLSALNKTIVYDNQPPLIAIFEPSDFKIFVAGETINVTASSFDFDGSVSKVELFLNGTLIGTDTSFPYNWTNLAALQNLAVGTYSLRALSTDNLGATAQHIITFFVASGGGSGNQLPALNFEIPFNNQQFPINSNIYIKVNASDTDGTISKVDLFVNGVFLRSETTAPYEWGNDATDNALRNMQSGNYVLKAVAIDNKGGVGEVSINISVVGGVSTNASPVVQFTTPTNQQTFPVGTNLSITTTATDSDGTIANVELFFNGNSLGQDSSSPYNWGQGVAVLQNLQPGTYTLRAVATDNQGAKGEQTISIAVAATNNLPVVQFTTPTNQQTFPVGTNLSITTSATDSDGTIANVELFFNGNSLGQDSSSPYNWGQGVAVLQNLQPGIYTLRAVATDNQGAKGEQTISIAVAATNNLPVVQFTTPTNQQTFPVGTNLSITTTATDSDGTIANVELFFNGNSLGQDSSSPYNWGQGVAVLQNLQPGTYTLRAVATDNQGAKGEQTISIAVAATQNNTPPVVNFSFPNDQQTFSAGANILVVASATDSDGTITGVELFINETLLRRDNSAPYQWGDLITDTPLRSLQAGNYTLKVVAYDNLGASSERTITMKVVSGTNGGNQPPSVSFNTPVNNQTLTANANLIVEVNAADTDGSVQSVALYLNNSLVRRDIALPYRWESTTDPTLANLQAGNYTLRAVARDNVGDSTAQSIQIVVQAGTNTSTAPVVRFIAPVNNDTLAAGTNVQVEVSATDNNGAVTKVDLFRNDVLVRTEFGAPYEWGKSTIGDAALKNLQPGTYTLKAIATDNSGETAEAMIKIVVIGEGGGETPVSPITLTFSEPTDQQILPRGTNLYVLLEVQDTTSGIKGVELSINDKPLRQKRTPPFEWDGTLRSDTLLRNLQPGTYTLKSLAVSNRRDSVEATLAIIVNDPPTVEFLMPVNLQKIEAGKTIFVSVEASDTDGTVSDVTLYLNGQLIRRDAALPYEWGVNDPNLQNLAVGIYTLKAVATDNRGIVSEKSIQIEVISPNILPELSFITPFDGQRLPSGTNISIGVSATDKDGVIASVSLYLNEQLVREDIAFPYEWGNALNQDGLLRNLTPGIYILKAVAKDDDGGISETTIDVEIYNTPPTIIFDTPLDGEEFPSGINLYVNLGVYDNDGTVASVKLYLNNQLIREDFAAPYEWGTPTTNDALLRNIQAGTYILRAVATDDDGESSESSITVRSFQSNQLPIISFDTPLHQQVIEAGTDLYVNVGAIDVDGTIAGVALYVNGQFTRTDAVAPYEWGKSNQNDILLKNIQPGTYTLRAIATDDDGEDNEAIITIQVIRTNFPPTVKFDTPSDVQVFPSGTNLYVNVGASDTDGFVSSVDLFLNGQLVRSDLTAPYEWGRNDQNDILLRNLQAGNYILKAVATDNKGSKAETNITVTIQRINNAPTVAFAAPLNNQNFPEGTTLSVNVNATDSDGSIANVKLYINDQFVRQDITAPYQWGFNDVLLQNLRAGTYTLRAEATDNSSLVSSTSVTINVTRTNRAPVVAFATPSQLQTFPQGTSLNVGVEAIDNDGSIVSVTLFLNNQLVGQDIVAPYEWGTNFPLLNNLVAGTYNLRAVALDNEGATDEETITITVEKINIPPTVSFSAPVNLQQFPAGSTLSVTVNASDSDGAISHVRLFLNNQLVRQDANAPYQWGINDPLLQNLAIGTYTLRALATDNEGSTTETSIVVQMIRVNQAPTLSFTTPTTGQELTSGSTLDVRVIANDTDGFVSNVRLFLNGQLVRQVNTAPYQWGINDPLLQNLQPGTYTLRAVATDNEAATSEATMMVTVVKVNTPPAVAFNTPLNTQQFSAGSNLSVVVNATDSDGFINNVELYFDGQSVRQELAPPFEWGADDAALRNLEIGNHTLRAVATDDKGAKSETSISISVINGQSNTPPTISITSPTNNQQFPVGTNLTVNANASDTDGSIASVRLFLNNQSVRTDNAAPYSWGIGDALLQNLQAGTYTLRAVATDNRGLTAETSVSISVVVQQSNLLPTISIASPTNNQQFSVGTNLNVVANASDTDGSIANVSLFLNNQLVRQDNAAPYSWGTGDASLQNLQAGAYSLRAVATDNQGATAEASINIQVVSTTTTSPTVSFAEPTNQAQLPVGTNLYVKVNATDDKAVRRVAFYLNGQLVRYETGAPYEWGKSNQTDNTLKNLQAGTYTLRAVAEDNDGNTSESTITITVGNTNSNKAPTISFTAPTNLQTFPIGTNLTVNVNASDSDGTISNVRLLVNNNLVRQDNVAPYTWGTGDAALQNLVAGTYTLKAIATDDDGATTEVSISIQVQNTTSSQIPVVNFSQPANNQTFTTGTNLTVVVNATDADGTIRDVLLYLNGTLVRRESTPPYEWGKSSQNDRALSNMVAGTYTLRAVATDNQGNTGETSIQITINNTTGGNTPTNNPIVAFAQPTNQSIFGVGTNLYVLVNATDNDGTITGVTLYLNGQPVRREAGAPYEWGKSSQNDPLLRGLASGTYNLRAVATDNQSNTGEATIQFTISNAAISSAALELRATPLQDNQTDLYVAPNPSSVQTQVSYTLPHQTDVQITVFDRVGSTVRILEQSQDKLQGTYTIDFDTQALSAGNYFIRLQTRDKVLIKKLVVLH